MIDVIKKKDLDNTYSIFIEADEGSFVFTFCGNLDLYFSYFGDDRLRKDEHSFLLDMDNYYLYRCFDNLYNTFVNDKAFKSSKKCSDFTYKCNYSCSSLLKNNVIEWHSDDTPYDEAAVLLIKKLDKSYKITIKEGIIPDIGMKTASVRFRSHDSIYEPYNEAFMCLYNNLCKHDFENEQILNDEYVNVVKVRKR